MIAAIAIFAGLALAALGIWLADVRERRARRARAVRRRAWSHELERNWWASRWLFRGSAQRRLTDARARHGKRG